MSTKNYILRMRKEVNQFRQHDKRYQELMSEHGEIKDSLQQTFQKIQSLADDFPDEEERKQMLGTLDETMTQLSELIKMNEEEIDNYVSQKFEQFKSRYPGIFKMFLKGEVDNDALTHVLNTLTLLEQGQITLEQGKEMGYHRFHR